MVFFYRRVHVKPSFFWIRAILPRKQGRFKSGFFVRVKSSKSLWPKFFPLWLKVTLQAFLCSEAKRWFWKAISWQLSWRSFWAGFRPSRSAPQAAIERRSIPCLSPLFWKSFKPRDPKPGPPLEIPSQQWLGGELVRTRSKAGWIELHLPWNTTISRESLKIEEVTEQRGPIERRLTQTNQIQLASPKARRKRP